MNTLVLYAGWALAGALLIGALAFVITCIGEGKGRPARMTLLVALPAVALWVLLLSVPFPYKTELLCAFYALGLISFLIISAPFGNSATIRIMGEQERLDERDALFHRFYTLKKGTAEFDAFYQVHPELKEFDESVRQMPDLGQKGGRSFHPMTAPYQCAEFEIIEDLSSQVDARRPAPRQVQASADEWTRRVKGYARYLGADLVGTTRLNPAYVYSHVARDASRWGEPVDLNHKNAIAIALRMDYKMVRHAPAMPTVTESAFKYFEAAKVATILARYIQLQGYEARAHVDGNYRVMCVPVAVDAGLGELGRMGLLMTPRFGPRVRLAVVSTNMPLNQDEKITFGVQDFCTICKKCATNCPSQSVDSGEKRIIRGAEKWQTVMESCYKYWRLQGTDCAVCMKVCPYSHPETVMHNMVRWLIQRNPLARRAALFLDDFMYGRKPKYTYALPDWHAQD